MKADRRSTDALISYVRVANIDLNIVTVKVLSYFDMVWAMFVARHGKAWLKPLPKILIVWEQHLEDAIKKYEYQSFVIDFMDPADWRTTQNWAGPPNRQTWVVHWVSRDFAFSTALLSIWHLNTSSRNFVWSVSHPPLNPQSPASFEQVTRLPPENASAPLDHSDALDEILLYHKLALFSTCSHAKNRNDPWPAIWSKAA